MKFDRVDCGSIFLWPILQACRNTRSPGCARCSFKRSPGRLPLGGTAALSQALWRQAGLRKARCQNDIGCSTTSSKSFWSPTITAAMPRRVSHHRSGSKFE
jgi:hypothetical protein